VVEVKWTPSSPSSPHWYDRAAFTALVYSHIRHTHNDHPDKPIGEFIREFDGLTSTAKAKAVRAATPGVTHLSQLDGRDDVIGALHDAMLQNAKPTSPSRLGAVGDEHYRQLLDTQHGVRRFWYKAARVTDGGVPWVIEIAVAETAQPGHTWFAVNHGPAFGDPLGRTFLSASSVSAWGAASFLATADADTSSSGNRAAVVHVICPAPQFVDKGKVALAVPSTVAQAAAKALAGATSTLRREAEQRRKDARRAQRARQRAWDEADRDHRENRWTIKEAVFAVLSQAKAAAGHQVAARTLYYKVRPLIQQFTDKELGYAYFSQELLPEYERTVAPLPGLYYEARGALHHPHDDQIIRLGTREVAAYIPPSWQFDKVLYIEKEGLEAQLAPYRLGQRYDMAIIYGKGFAVTACRELLALFEIREEMKIFVLHDADINGYDIARTLGEATRRMPNHNVDVIDLGLTVPQAIEYELETEEFTRRKALPAELELDDDALEWFTGEPIDTGYGKPHYECTRCELNAFSADELAEFIEAGLQRHGATEKVVPPADVLAEHVQEVRDDALTDLVNTELARLVDIDEVVRQLIADRPDLVDVDEARIRDTFTDNPTLSWRSSAGQLVAEDIEAADGLTESVRQQVAEQLAASMNDDEGETGERP
jgi:hypothetical protein